MHDKELKEINEKIDRINKTIFEICIYINFINSQIKTVNTFLFIISIPIIASAVKHILKLLF